MWEWRASFWGIYEGLGAWAFFVFFFFLFRFSGCSGLRFGFLFFWGFLRRFPFQRRLAALGGLSSLLEASVFLLLFFRPFWISEALAF